MIANIEVPKMLSIAAGFCLIPVTYGFELAGR
jgi:hypothetical protein